MTHVAFGWIARVESDDVGFAEVWNPYVEMASLDSQLRTAIAKPTAGSEAERNPDVVSKLSAKLMSNACRFSDEFLLN